MKQNNTNIFSIQVIVCNHAVENADRAVLEPTTLPNLWLCSANYVNVRPIVYMIKTISTYSNDCIRFRIVAQPILLESSRAYSLWSWCINWLVAYLMVEVVNVRTTFFASGGVIFLVLILLKPKSTNQQDISKMFIILL